MHRRIATLKVQLAITGNIAQQSPYSRKSPLRGGLDG